MHPIFRLGSALFGILLLTVSAFATAPVFQRSDSIGLSLGQAVDYHVVAIGTVTSYSAQGLPNGVAIDGTSGWVHGTPTDVGTYRVVVTATNNDGSSTMTLTIAVVAPDAAPLIYAPLQFDAYHTSEQGGDRFSCTLQATGNPTGFQNTDALPAGWTFSAGTLVGSTATPGLFLVPVSATNANGIGSAAVTVRVHPCCTQVQQTTGALKAGDTFSVTLTFSRPMTFTGPAPYLEFHTYPNGATRRLAYASGNGTATFVFSYTIAADDAPGDILLYKAIQPALGSAVDGLADQDGLNLGTTLPISGAYTPTATVASSSTGTPTGSSPSSATVPTSAATTDAAASTPTSTAATAPTSPAAVASDTSSRLVNLSARGVVSEGSSGRAFIAGFVVSGSSPKHMLLRAVGPTLGGFGVQSPLPNPQLRVFDNNGHVVADNEDWSGADVSTTGRSVGAFELPTGSRDSALSVTLSPGNYSMQDLQ